MKNIILKAALLLIQPIIRALPLEVALRAGASLGRIVSHFVPRERAISELQIAWALPELRKGDGAARLTTDTFAHLGTSIAEIFHIKKLVPRVTENLFPSLAKITSDRKGALILSGHLGCFELLAAYHRLQGADYVVVGRTPNYPFLANFLSELRKDYGVTTVWRNESDGARALLKTLRSGRSIAALIDQDTDLDNVFVPFFSLPAAYPVALIRLAIRLEKPIFSSFIVRVAPGEHRVYSEEIPYDPTRAEVEHFILAEFSRRLESYVFQYPDQWLWWHRRWRRQADRTGEDNLRSTKEYMQWLTEKIQKRAEQEG